jgi:hypothetical protein
MCQKFIRTGNGVLEEPDGLIGERQVGGESMVTRMHSVASAVNRVAQLQIDQLHVHPRTRRSHSWATGNCLTLYMDKPLARSERDGEYRRPFSHSPLVYRLKSAQMTASQYPMKLYPCSWRINE